MSISKRPYIGRLRLKNWQDKATGEVTPGILLQARNGVCAHLTASEARKTADKLHDLADKLDRAPTAPRAQSLAQPRSAPLTAADGTEEQPLESTPAD